MPFLSKPKHRERYAPPPRVLTFHNRKRGTSQQRRLGDYTLIWIASGVETIFRLAFEPRLISEVDFQPLAVKLDYHIAKISDERPMS